MAAGRHPLLSNATIWILAFLFAYPCQVIALIGVQLRSNPEGPIHSTNIGAYVCTNYVHGTTPFRCNFARLVRNAAEGAIVLDVFTVGGFFVATVLTIVILLSAIRMIHLRLWARPNTSLERSRDR